MKRGHFIINKQTKAMPFLNRGAKVRWPRWAALWGGVGDADDPSLPAIALHRGAVAGAEGNTVTFEDGSSTEADIVLLATGYKQRFPFLFPRGGESSEEGEEDDPLPRDRLICAPGEERFVLKPAPPRAAHTAASHAV